VSAFDVELMTVSICIWGIQYAFGTYVSMYICIAYIAHLDLQRILLINCPT